MAEKYLDTYLDESGTHLHIEVLVWPKIRFGSSVYMLPPPKKNSNCQKGVAYTSRQSICVLRVAQKTDIFVDDVKKEKTCSQKTLFLTPNFVLIHNPINKFILRFWDVHSGKYHEVVS
jgi:hypothetical protein